MKAGSFQVSLRCIKTDHMRACLGQCFRQHTRPTGYIEHATARSDIDTGEKWACQIFAPAPHESLVGVGISPIISWLCGFHGMPSPRDQGWTLTRSCGPRVSPSHRVIQRNLVCASQENMTQRNP